MVESGYGRSALRITNGEIKDAQELALDLTATIPADDAFESAFATMQVSKGRPHAISCEHSNNRRPDRQNQRTSLTTIRLHIKLGTHSPRKAKARGMGGVRCKQRALFTGRLGNLAILQRTPNSTSR